MPLRAVELTDADFNQALARARAAPSSSTQLGLLDWKGPTTHEHLSRGARAVTFLAALKTGKPMRRAGWWLGDRAAKRYMTDRWLVLSSDGAWTWRDGSAASPPTRADLLRDDWEVAP